MLENSTLECNGGGDLPAKYDNNSSLRMYLRRLLLAQSANSLVRLWYPYCTAASFVRFMPSQDSGNRQSLFFFLLKIMPEQAPT